MVAKLDELGEADPGCVCSRSRAWARGWPRRWWRAWTMSRFKSANQVGSYAGLVPKQMESGEMKRVGRITRRGSTLLRGMLVEVAWMVYRHNPWARAFVLKVSRGMKSRKRIAIVALARKLLMKLWAMLRDGTTWQDPVGSSEKRKRKKNAWTSLRSGRCGAPLRKTPVRIGVVF